MQNEYVNIACVCPMCGSETVVRAKAADYNRWKGGELIQHAMPYLSPEERERLITGFCADCFEQMFSPNNALVNVANDFYDDRYESLKKALESGKVVEIYVDCIGHTRARSVEQEYAAKLKQEYSDRLVIKGDPGEYGTTYKLTETK